MYPKLRYCYAQFLEHILQIEFKNPSQVPKLSTTQTQGVEHPRTGSRLASISRQLPSDRQQGKQRELSPEQQPLCNLRCVSKLQVAFLR